MQCEDLVPGAFGVAVHIEEDVDSVGVNPVSSLKVARDLGQVDEMLSLTLDFGAE